MDIEQTAKSSIQEKKIRVSFLPADSVTETPPPDTNGVSSSQEDHPPILLPWTEAVTPHRGTSTEQSVVGSISRPESRPAESKNLGEARESAYNNSPGVKSTAGAAA